MRQSLIYYVKGWEQALIVLIHILHNTYRIIGGMIRYLFERFEICLTYVVELENYKMYTLYLIITTLCLYSLGYKYAVYTIGHMPMTSL